ncbi:metal-dependent transcriptional regulator [Nigerium massiliense]
MYLKTIYELVEEGVPPLRARIVERLHQSGPTVSQTVARMERDGLLRVGAERRIELSPEGRQVAGRVMRKHRLAELLLTDVIGLGWDLAHDEACRWEHVMSEAAERRLYEVLNEPTMSPYGNPIPALEELGGVSVEPRRAERLSDVLDDRPEETVRVRTVSIGEGIQPDVALLGSLDAAGLKPNAEALIEPRGDLLAIRLVRPAAPRPGGGGESEPVMVDGHVADFLFVEPLDQ